MDRRSVLARATLIEQAPVNELQEDNSNREIREAHVSNIFNSFVFAGFAGREAPLYCTVATNADLDLVKSGTFVDNGRKLLTIHVSTTVVVIIVECTCFGSDW